MSLQTPTIQELRDSIVAELEAALSQTVPLLPVGFTRVLAAAIAGAIIIIYKFCGFMLLQQYAQYASYEEITVNGKTFSPLIRLGDSWGVPPPAAAIRAEQTIQLTVVSQTGSLPAGTVYTFPATGFTYVTQTAVNLNASTVSVGIIAVSGPKTTLGEGAAGTVPVDSTVSMVVPDARVMRDATVTGTTSAGADKETEASYRKRVIDRRRRPPQGGAHADYYHWALEVSGIVAAYPYNAGPGKIDVYIEASEASSGSADGIPTDPQVDAVQNYLREPTRRPANDAVTVKKIVRDEFDVDVFGLSVEDEDTVKDRIQSALEQHFRTLEPYIDGLSYPPRADLITLPSISAVVLDVVAAAGGYYSSVEINGGTVAYQQLTAGHRAKLGALNYT